MEVGSAGTVAVGGFITDAAAFGTTQLTGIGEDALLARYSATGTLQSADHLGGTGSDLSRGLYYDGTGSLYLAGQFTVSIDFNAAATLAAVGGPDSFVAKLGAACTLAVPTVAAPTAVCAGQTLTLTATNSNPGTTVQWTGPNGFTATTLTATIPNATPAASGTYTLTVTSAAQGCSVSATATVSVDAAPAAPTPAGTFGRCGPGSLTLTVGSPVAAAYAWYTTATGGTPIAGATGASYVTPSLSATTTYYVAARTGAGCEGPRAAVVATIAAVPTIALRALGPTTFCDGDIVTLQATGSGTGVGGTYQWYRNGTLLSGAFVTTYPITQGGSYTIQVTTTAGCSATSAPIVVTVNPAANATFAYPAATVCLGGLPSVTPTISGTTGGTFSVLPATGVVINAATGALTLTGATAGTYAVSYAVGGQCPATASQTITLTSASTAAFQYAQPSYCTGAGQSAVPTLAPGAQAGTFSATPAGLTLHPNLGIVDLSSSAPGVYTVVNSVAAGGTCPAALATTSLTITATPAQPTFTATPAGGTVVLTAAPAPAYQWHLNGAPIGGATAQTYTVGTAAQNGLYTVVALSAGGVCVSVPSLGQTITITGTAEAAADAMGLTLFPTPTPDGRVTLTLAAASAARPLVVLDAAGREVLRATLPAHSARYELDARRLPAGVYAVRVGAAVRRLVRE